MARRYASVSSTGDSSRRRMRSACSPMLRWVTFEASIIVAPPLQGVERPVALPPEQELADRLEAAGRGKLMLAGRMHVAEVLLEALFLPNARRPYAAMDEVDRLRCRLRGVGGGERQRDRLFQAHARLRPHDLLRLRQGA